MEWPLLLLLILGGLMLLLAIGVPIAFSFLFVAIIAVWFLWGGPIGESQLVNNVYQNMTRFTLLPLPLFILMGEVIFHSGLAPRMIDTIDMWLGRLPGRLGLIAVLSGTLLAALTGASHGSTAMLGSLLTPEMEKRGYKKPMSLGPVLGSAGLATMIPPSAQAVFLAAMAGISIGKLLMAIIIPGIVMAALYALYIIARCWLQPSIAPPYTVALPPLSHRLVATLKYILPLGSVIFCVIGFILLGIATPSEAAATGCLGVYVLVACYKRLTWEVFIKSLTGTLRVTVLVFTILVGALVFAQVLSFSGASREFALFIKNLNIPPMLIVVCVYLFAIFLGMFMTGSALISIIIPIFMPVIKSLGFDPVWFCVGMLICCEMAPTSPPFGSGLYIMKGVAPSDTTMGDIYTAGLPFLGCDMVTIALVMAFPTLALWLPGTMS